MTAAREPRASVVRHARGGLRNLRELVLNLPQSSQASTGVWKHRREDLRLQARLEHMLKLAVAVVFLVALAGAAADLVRGRRPVLFA
jgi:hypothetical protein